MVKFLKKGIRENGKYMPAWYSKKEDGRVVVYARDLIKGLPACLNVINNTDSQVDYFEKDKAIINQDSPFYSQVIQYAR